MLGACGSSHRDARALSTQVTPAELTTKLMDAAIAGGAELRICTASGFELDDAGSAVAVLTADGGKVPCRNVVVALGPWTPLVGDWLDDGVTVPMTGIKSSSMTLPGAAHPLTAAHVLREPRALFSAEDGNGCHLEVYPRPNGDVYICGLGGSDHVAGDRLRPGGDAASADAVAPNRERVVAALASLRNLAPALTGAATAATVEAQACMRPCPPDGLPLMGTIDRHPNIAVCAGHNCWGILWGPVSGYLSSLDPSVRMPAVNSLVIRDPKVFANQLRFSSLLPFGLLRRRGGHDDDEFTSQADPSPALLFT